MTSAPPSSYNQVMYDCRYTKISSNFKMSRLLSIIKLTDWYLFRSTPESSNNTMVGGSTNMSHQQHHVLNYGDESNLLESSGMVDFQTNASSSSSSYSQVHHRLSYSGDNNPSSNNYRWKFSVLLPSSSTSALYTFGCKPVFFCVPRF